MAVTLAWKVEAGYLFSPTNFTTRVAGLDIDEQLMLNGMASFSATVTLNNFDGALTPNGGGTYSSWDWFQFQLKISATATSTSSETVVVFQGIITDFDLLDDGEFSTVTLRATDVWTVAGRTLQASVAAIAAQSPTTYINNISTYGQFSAAFPTFGPSNPVYSQLFDRTAVTPTQVTSTVAATSVTYADLLNQIVMPGQNGFAWPTTMSQPVDTYIEGIFVGTSMTRGAAYRTTFTFDPPSSMTSQDLPVGTLAQGWNIDRTINTATQTSLDQPFGPVAITSTNAAYAEKYGSRTVAFNQTACPAGYVIDKVTELTNRFAAASFGPQQLTVTASTIKSYCANAAYQSLAALLDVYRGFLDKAIITWTGTGLSTTQTANCVILGKRIRATPSDTEITLTLGNWTDFHSFILDTDKLDTDRLG